MSQSSQSTNSSQQSQTAPWAPSQGVLSGLLAKLGGTGTGVNPLQRAALGQISNNASGLPNFGGDLSGTVGGLLSGIPNLNDFLKNNYQQLQTTLSPYMQPGYTDPTKTPGMQNLLQTIQQDVGNNIKGEFAGAGRDLSPAEGTAVARGIAQGEAAPLLGQYNQNVAAQQGAAGSLFSGGTGTAGGLLGNAQSGVGLAGAIPGLTNMAPLQQLEAQNLKFSLPLSQMGAIEGLTLPIAGLGSQSSGSGSVDRTFTPSLMSDIGQGMQLGGQAAGGMSSLFNGMPQFFRGGWGY